MRDIGNGLWCGRFRSASYLLLAADGGWAYPPLGRGADALVPLVLVRRRLQRGAQYAIARIWGSRARFSREPVTTSSQAAGFLGIYLQACRLFYSEAGTDLGVSRRWRYN